MTAEQTTPDRLAEIRSALASVPAPPWQWIGDRRTRAMLTTTHSGWQYLLSAELPLDRHGNQAENLDGSPIWADLEIRDQRDGEKYATLRPAREMAVGRTEYDPDTIRDIDNPVARWMRDAPQYVADLLAEVEHRLPLGDVDHFLRRERDEYEPRGECWNTVSDVLDSFRLHVITGTPLTAPRPEGGPEAFGVGKEPLTEAEKLRRDNKDLRAALDGVRRDAAKWLAVESTITDAVEKGGGLLDAEELLELAAESSSPTGEKGEQA